MQDYQKNVELTVIFLFKNLGDIRLFCRATDTPVLEFWSPLGLKHRVGILMRAGVRVTRSLSNLYYCNLFNMSLSPNDACCSTKQKFKIYINICCSFSYVSPQILIGS